MIKLTRHIVVFSALLLQCGLICGEENIIDSLKNKAQHAPASERINILNDLSMAYWSVSLDYSIKYAHEALEIAEYLNDNNGIADALNRLGNAEYFKANYQQSLIHYNRSLEIRLDKDDSQKILASYNNLYYLHDIMGDKDKAYDYIRKAVELSIILGDESEIAHYSNILGTVKYELHDFENAKINIERALEIYVSMEDNQGIARTLNNMGSMYQRMSLYDKAQEHYFRALNYYRKIEDLNGIASVKNNIGIIHKQLNNLDIALEYYYKSLEIFKEQEGERTRIAPMLNNIGIIWFEKGDYETSLDYYTRALESYENIKDIQGIATANHNTGILHTRMGNYHDAQESYIRSLEINKSVGDRYSIANNYNNLGELHLLQNDYNKALKFLEESLEIATRINAREIICENYMFQSQIFLEINNYENSLFFYKLYDSYRDSIFTMDTGNIIAELHVRHKRESQINELDILQKNNYIQQLQISEQNTILLYLAGIALLTGVFVFVILGMYQYRNKLNIILQLKTRQLENANRKLMQSEKKLHKLNTTKDKFFSIIAHDLKNPFNALLGFSETLKQNYTDLTREQIYTYIDIINKSATNLYRLLENLLEWSKSQTGNIKYKPEKFKLKDVTETGIDTVKVNAERKNIKIKTDINPDLTAFADKNIISTVIRNLISNAVKFTPHNGKVIIYAKDRDRHIELSVSDNGIGIEPGEQKKLFTLDYNITTVGTDDEKGTGLGLLLCKEFVEKSGGKLWIESEEGIGSTFTFTIPK